MASVPVLIIGRAGSLAAEREADLPWLPTTTATGVDTMLDVRHLDLEEIATALQDQSAYEYRWLIDPASGEIMMWTADGGIDGKTPVDLDELDLVPIEALPSSVWHRDMADFAERISDEQAGRRLQRAIQGRGAFRRFKDELQEEYPHLLTAWHAFQHARATRRAIDWLLDNSLIDVTLSRAAVGASTEIRTCRETNGRVGGGARQEAGPYSISRRSAVRHAETRARSPAISLGARP